jgi:hypothetical protein
LARIVVYRSTIGHATVALRHGRIQKALPAQRQTIDLSTPLTNGMTGMISTDDMSKFASMMEPTKRKRIERSEKKETRIVRRRIDDSDDTRLFDAASRGGEQAGGDLKEGPWATRPEAPTVWDLIVSWHLDEYEREKLCDGRRPPGPLGRVAHHRLAIEVASRLARLASLCRLTHGRVHAARIRLSVLSCADPEIPKDEDGCVPIETIDSALAVGRLAMPDDRGKVTILFDVPFMCALLVKRDLGDEPYYVARSTRIACSPLGHGCDDDEEEGGLPSHFSPPALASTETRRINGKKADAMALVDRDDGENECVGDRREGRLDMEYDEVVCHRIDWESSSEFSDSDDGEGSDDDYDDDEEDRHEDEWGTLSFAPEDGSRWELRVFNHYRDGLFLRHVQVALPSP